MAKDKPKSVLPFRLVLPSAARAACDPLRGSFQCGRWCIPVTAQCCSDGSFCNFGNCYYRAPGRTACCYRPKYVDIYGRCVP